MAPILGADPGTLARQWARLKEEGYAWVTGLVAGMQTALIEVRCELKHLDSIVTTLQTDHRVHVIDFSSGQRDLLVLVYARDLAEIANFAVERLGKIRGIRSAQTHLCNERLLHGGNWRLRSLKPSEVSRIPQPRPPRSRAAKHVPEDLRESIVREIWRDGRVPISLIAERSGFSPQRVSDGLATLIQQEQLFFRTDIARSATEWPIYTWYFIEAPASSIARARATLTSIPEVRMAFTAASRFNLILAVWLRQLSDIDRFELALEKALVGARIADRAVVFRTARHMNSLLGADSRATGLALPD